MTRSRSGSFYNRRRPTSSRATTETWEDCPICGFALDSGRSEDEETADHVLAKVFLDEPYPVGPYAMFGSQPS